MQPFLAVLRGDLGHRSLHRVGSLHALGFVERGGGRFVVLGLFRRSVEVDVHKRPRSVGCWLAAKSVGPGQPAPLGKGRPPEQAERALKLKQIGATDLALRTGLLLWARHRL